MQWEVKNCFASWAQSKRRRKAVFPFSLRLDLWIVRCYFRVFTSLFLISTLIEGTSSFWETVDFNEDLWLKIHWWISSRGTVFEFYYTFLFEYKTGINCMVTNKNVLNSKYSTPERSAFMSSWKLSVALKTKTFRFFTLTDSFYNYCKKYYVSLLLAFFW